METEKKDMLKQLRAARSALTKTQFEYWLLRKEYELQYGNSELGHAIDEKEVKPRMAKREKARKTAGKKPVEKKVKKQVQAKKPKPIKKVTHVKKRQPPLDAPPAWTAENDCKAPEVHGEECKASTEVNKLRAKADTRHEGKMYPTCKACKTFIAKKRKQERDEAVHLNSDVEDEDEEESPQPMDVANDEDEQEENNEEEEEEEEE